jgi:hypothetical protein
MTDVFHGGDLDGALRRHLSGPGQTWLRAAQERIAAGQRHAASMAIAEARRAMANEQPFLQLSMNPPSCAWAPAAPWPGTWSTVRAVRICLAQAIPTTDVAQWRTALDGLFVHGSLDELEDLYAGLALLPHPEWLVHRAAAGVRHSATSVMAAVAIDNAYPARWLDEGAWNQMVLKS